MGRKIKKVWGRNAFAEGNAIALGGRIITTRLDNWRGEKETSDGTHAEIRTI